mgnify:CR=1 FL=1
MVLGLKIRHKGSKINFYFKLRHALVKSWEIGLISTKYIKAKSDDNGDCPAESETWQARDQNSGSYFINNEMTMECSG